MAIDPVRSTEVHFERHLSAKAGIAYANQLFAKYTHSSRPEVRNVRQNWIFAFFHNALGVPHAAGVLALFFALACTELRASPVAGDTQLEQLLTEAERTNPDIEAARREVDAVRSRIAPASALDDPMLEAGVLNVPVPSLSLNKEDMTMKMVGVTQRLPYPGKRALRSDVAEKEAEAATDNLHEVVNRVRRDIKVAYLDLSQVDESARLVEKNKRILEQFLSIAEARYAVGQASQADVLKAQTQLSRMVDEVIKLGRERPAIEAELNRALGRVGAPDPAATRPPRVADAVLRLGDLQEMARSNRPQLLSQQRVIERNDKALDLARKDYYPDFDVRLSYGQRDNYQDIRRDDMVSLTVAINLPMWRESKRDPRVAEAQALRGQAERMYESRLNETNAMLRQQVATAEQSLKSVRLYETAILPQSRLAVDAALAAYKVNRVDFFTLLDDQMTVLNYEIAYVANVVSRNKALAEIEFLVGKKLF